MVGLEDEADFAPAQQRERVLVHAGDLLAVENDGARGGRVKSGQQPEQRALAAAGGTGNGDELAARNVQIHTLQDFDPVNPGVDDFAEAANSNHPKLL